MTEHPGNSLSRLFIGTHPTRTRRTGLLCGIFWGVLTLLLLLYALRPIADPDFWWHLKSGQLMLQQHGLLQADPFNYTGSADFSTRKGVILRGYWLWQLAAASAYTLLGFNGIFLLKLLSAALVVWAVQHQFSRQRLQQTTRIVLAALGAVAVINVYHLERPQVFSLFFMTLLLGMVARIRLDQSPSPALLPVMALWANTHGGFVVGDLVLALAAAGFLLQYRGDRKRQLLLAAWGGGGILASFINPNGWNAFIVSVDALRNTLGPALVSEYRSSWQLFLHQSQLAAVCLWTIVALLLAGMLLTRHRFWPDIFIVLFLIPFGLKYVRNTGFIAVALLPMTGWYLEQALCRLNLTVPRYARGVAAALLVAAVSWLTVGEWRQLQRYPGPVSGYFPAGMTNFLNNSGLRGNIFNEYNSGGYLDWALFPRWQTFIDGRELDPRVSSDYLLLASGSKTGTGTPPVYVRLLQSYRIDVVAQRIAIGDGRLQPLLKLLLNDPQWVPVYLDGQAFVLARLTPANSAAIRASGIDKSSFVETLVRVTAKQTAENPASLQILVTHADMLMYAGRRTEAASLLQALERKNPDAGMMSYLRAQYAALGR